MFVKALGLARLLLRENGLLWSVCCLSYVTLHYGFRLPAHALERLMRRMELGNGLPGMSSRNVNRFIWENWNWERHGEEWTDSPEWKSALLQDALFPYVRDCTAILEIGPGGGRWTDYLRRYAARLILVDLCERCLDVCRARFADCPNILYLLTDGASLTGVADGSVDFIWSFDVFVHITPQDIESYLKEMRRVLAPGGIAVIHHAKGGGVHGTWRSRMTRERFAEMVRREGFSIIGQKDYLGEARIPVSPHEDTVTLFRK